MRNFDDWFGTFEKSLATYDYFTDFSKVYNNTDKLKIGLNLLNSLVGSENIESEFKILLQNYTKEILPCIPMLLAKRVKELEVTDFDGKHIYNFKELNYSINQYCVFMEKTGLFELIKNHIISNLVDYMFGVEVGSDSNSRKNRTGEAMEDLVERYIIKAGYAKDKNYFKQMKTSEIKKNYNIDLTHIKGKRNAEKKFDFVIYKNKTVYCIETNFYHTGGSKLNETSRSYKQIALETKNIKNVKFIWITDGEGWTDAKSNLKETFDVLENLYNINDLQNGVLSDL